MAAQGGFVSNLIGNKNASMVEALYNLQSMVWFGPYSACPLELLLVSVLVSLLVVLDDSLVVVLLSPSPDFAAPVARLAPDGERWSVA